MTKVTAQARRNWT